MGLNRVVTASTAITVDKVATVMTENAMAETFMESVAASSEVIKIGSHPLPRET